MEAEREKASSVEMFVVFHSGGGGGGVFLAFCRQEARRRKKRAVEQSVTAVLETLFMTVFFGSPSGRGNRVQLRETHLPRVQIISAANLIILDANTRRAVISLSTCQISPREKQRTPAERPI